MESKILEYMLQYGVFGVLFVWLLFDTRKDSKQREKAMKEDAKEREKQYQDTIKENQDTIKENQNIIVKLTEKFNIVEDMKEDLKEIKDKFFK